MSPYSPNPIDPSLMPDHALPIGARVDSFRVTGLIGAGAVGMVYRAYDAILQRDVALKEYFPPMLAQRAEASMHLVMRSPGAREPFDAGRRLYLEEARMLARFEHPALMRVHRFWEGNGTAYMAMPLVEGQTLEQVLASRAVAPDEAQLRAWLEPLLDALALLHSAGCLHRDIASDSIRITTNGPLLLDFGAARQCLGEMTRALPAMLRPGYTPIEQYSPSAVTPQGPWTDLYALAAVLTRAITGGAPASAAERVLEDRQPLLWRTHAGRYAASFLHAIDTALAVRPEQRPQSVAQWRALLEVRAAAPDEAVAASAGTRKLWIGGAVALGLAALVAAIGPGGEGADRVPEAAVQAAPVPATPAVASPSPAPSARSAPPVIEPAVASVEPAAGGDRPAAAGPSADPADTGAGVSAADNARAAPDPVEMLTREPPSSSGRPRLTLAEELAAEAESEAPASTTAAATAAAAAATVAAATATGPPPAKPRAAAVPPRRATPKTVVARADEPKRNAACRALLQQASLKALTAAEVATVKRECR